MRRSINKKESVAVKSAIYWYKYRRGLTLDGFSELLLIGYF